MTGRARDHHRTTRPARAAAMLAAAAIAAAGCMTGAPRAGPAGERLPPGRAAWLLTRSALAQLVTDPAVGGQLARSKVYEILRPGQAPLPGVAAVPVVTFPAVAALGDALASGQLPAGTRAVLYDPEAWSFTPAAEQRYPVRAAARAAELAHARGLQLIVAPALNLTTVLAPDGGAAPRWRRFLDLRLAGAIARVADIIELQAQSLERSTATYATFVREAAAQARSARPGVTVLAGLSTNPPGPVVRSQQLTAAIQASWHSVEGFWLNIPGRGPRCPTCNPPRPDVGIEALRAVL
jgi:hypothetical protein